MLGEQILIDDVSVPGFVPETNTDSGAASDTSGSSILRVKSYLSPISAVSDGMLDPIARLRTVLFHKGFDSVKVLKSFIKYDKQTLVTLSFVSMKRICYSFYFIQITYGQ